MQGSLVAKLRVLRAERGLTLRQAAERARVRPATLSDIEHGRSQPHDVTLAKIAKAYGVPLGDLLEEPVPKAPAPLSGQHETGLIRRTIPDAAGVSDHVRTSIFDRLDDLEAALEAYGINGAARYHVEQIRELVAA